MLFKRYSSPLILLDNLIETNQLEDFIVNLNEKVIDDLEYDLWIHKIHDMSFDEFRNKIHSNESNVTMTKEEVKTSVLKSKNILDGFIPGKEE